VVDLVLHAHRQQAVELALEFGTAAVTRTHAHARGPLDLSNTCGTDRQPSSVSSTPSRARISGLMSTSGWSRGSLTSMTMMRWCTLTWVAARPMPGAAYMVSSMSSISWPSSASKVATGAARVRRRGSGNSRMVSRAMDSASPVVQSAADCC
jgi:hypothetical protein